MTILYCDHFYILTSTQVNPLRTWLIGDRKMYLEELLRGDGRGDCWKDEEGHAACRSCDDGEGTIRCMDCFGDHLSCDGCTVGLHVANPLHRIEVRYPILSRSGSSLTHP